MWFGMMWWWLVPLAFFLLAGGRHRRRYRTVERSERESVGELRRAVEAQRGYIEELEGRLSRVEDGLEFAERLLAERATAGAR